MLLSRLRSVVQIDSKRLPWIPVPNDKLQKEHWSQGKKVREKSKESHNHKPQNTRE